MIILDALQGSEEWHRARAGIPTASEFSKIHTTQGKPSTSASTYMYKLLAEWWLEGPIETFTSEWMERGQILEDEARLYYVFETGRDVVQVGFCYFDEQRLYGASPDGLVGDDGGLEIKCPSPAVHMKYLLANKVPTEYVTQVQGNMLVTGRKWWDFLSYSPGLPPLLYRMNRDDRFCMGLKAALHKFLVQLTEKQMSLSAMMKERSNARTD